MSKIFQILSVFAVLLLFPALLQAEEELSYDDGSGEAWGGLAAAGTSEDVMFYLEHPAVLKKIKLMFHRTGSTMVHVWRDGGGNDPVLEGGDLITPIEINVENANEWVELDIFSEGVVYEKPEYVHVGIVRNLSGGALKIDTSSGGQGYSFVYYPNDVAKYGLGDGDFMVRLVVDYFNQVTDFTFEDLTEVAGLNGSSRPAWGDYNNDGYDDLLASASKLYRNNGDGTFTDVSEEAGIVGIGGSGVWGDFDNDGQLDYYAFNHGETYADCDRLVKNNGDGTFSALEPGPGAPFDFHRSEAAAWADYDMDGWLDLYVANYEKAGDELSIGTPDKLWHNEGGYFVDVSAEAGIYPYGTTYFCGRGLSWADFDNDGDPDLYVSNYRLDPNFLWLNNGDGTFTDVSLERGVKGVFNAGSYGHTIGSAWGDFNNDGYLDLFAANLAHPRFINFSDKSMLYINSGPPEYTFEDIREDAGITYAETHSSPIVFDYDNDGWLDIYVTAIYAQCYSFLYKNKGDLSFEDVTYSSGTRVFNGWGVSASDTDNDGQLDLMTRSFLRNKGNDNHWLKVKLVGYKSNKSCIGCRATVEKLDGTKLIREVEGGVGTGSQNSQVLHFGLGADDSVVSLIVRWSDGSETLMNSRNLQVDRLLTVEEEIGEYECTNDEGSCLDDLHVKICRNLSWVELECPEDTYCEDGFCKAYPVVVDGDEEIDGDEEMEIEQDQDEEVDPDGDMDMEAEIPVDGDDELDTTEIEEEQPASDGDEDETQSDGDEFQADGDDSDGSNPADGDMPKSGATGLGKGCAATDLPSSAFLIIVSLLCLATIRRCKESEL